MGVSNNITAFLNFIAVLSSIPTIASGIWLASKPDNQCIHFLCWPILFLGLAILLVSLSGFVGAYWNKQPLLAFYLFIMALLISLLLILIVLAFILTGPSADYSVPGRAFREYRLSGFSAWLRDRITNSENWRNIRVCLGESSFCAKLNEGYISADHFFAAHISPLQSGCCKPPTICGYQYVNPTLWINPVNTIADPDCTIWNNDETQLCYNCDSCKAGLLGNLRKEWIRVNVVLIIAVVVLIWVYLMACSAFRNAQTQDHFSRSK